MDKFIEYIGTPSEWKRCFIGDIANKKPIAVKSHKKLSKATLWNLAYRGQNALQSVPYAVAMAKMNSLIGHNYQKKFFSITKTQIK